MDWFTFWFSQRIAWVHLNKDVPAAESASVITSAMCFVLLILWAVKHLLGRSLNCLEILDGLLWNYLQTSEILKGWIPLNLETPLNLYLASPQVLFRFINTLTCFSKLVIMVDIIPAALLYLITGVTASCSYFQAVSGLCHGCSTLLPSVASNASTNTFQVNLLPFPSYNLTNTEGCGLNNRKYLAIRHD